MKKKVFKEPYHDPGYGGKQLLLLAAVGVGVALVVKGVIFLVNSL